MLSVIPVKDYHRGLEQSALPFFEGNISSFVTSKVLFTVDDIPMQWVSLLLFSVVFQRQEWPYHFESSWTCSAEISLFTIVSTFPMERANEEPAPRSIREAIQAVVFMMYDIE